MIEGWARAHMLLALAPTESTSLVADELGDGIVYVVLSPAGEVGYQSTADRLAVLYHDGSALPRPLPLLTVTSE